MANAAEKLSSLHPAINIASSITGEPLADNEKFSGSDRILEGVSDIPIVGIIGKITGKVGMG